MRNDFIDKLKDLPAKEIYPYCLQYYLGIPSNITELATVKMINLIKRIDYELSKIPVEVSCSIGCTYCCRFNVDIFIHERLFVLVHLAFLNDDTYRILNLQIKEWGQKFSKLISENNLNGFLTDKEKYHLMVSKYETSKIYCPFLMDNRCIIYDVRPIVCRTFFSCSPPIQCANRKRIVKPARADIIRNSALNILTRLDKEFFDTFNKFPFQPIGYYFFEHLSQINGMMSMIKEYSQTVPIDNRPICTLPNFNNISISTQKNHLYWPIYQFLEKCFETIDITTRTPPDNFLRG